MPKPIPEDHYRCHDCKKDSKISSMRFVDDEEILAECGVEDDGFCFWCGSFNITVHGEEP